MVFHLNMFVLCNKQFVAVLWVAIFGCPPSDNLISDHHLHYCSYHNKQIIRRSACSNITFDVILLTHKKQHFAKNKMCDSRDACKVAIHGFMRDRCYPAEAQALTFYLENCSTRSYIVSVRAQLPHGLALYLHKICS